MRIFHLLSVTGLGVVTGAGLWYWNAHALQREPVVEAVLVYEEGLEPIPVDAILQPGQRAGLLVGMARDSVPPEYLGILEGEFARLGLKVAAVFPDEPRQVALERAKSSHIPYVIDREGRMQRFLSYVPSHGHGATLFYSQDYKVKFHSLTVADNRLLRQVVEKYLLGKTEVEARLLAGC